MTDSKDTARGLRIRPQQQRAHDKIGRILDATAQLLLNEDVAALTVAAIAREADLPPPTVYRYFPDKLAILAALAERSTDRVDDATEQALLAMFAQGLDNPDWPHIIQMIYHLYRAEPGYVPVLRAAGASRQLRDIACRSNERIARRLVLLLGARIDMETGRLQRVARLLAEAAQAHFELALLESDEPEAEAIIREAGYMVDVLYQHYRAAFLRQA